MDPARYRRVKELFMEADERSDEERRAFLDEACGADADLRSEVEELLASGESSRAGALGRALSGEGPGAAAVPAAGLPERIGRYRVLRVCGYGGMGTVYEAEQDSPRRRVALKVIQAGSSRADVLSRFRREAEILGRLQHPGIAQVFEAGEFTRDGQTLPFIAMEFLDGLPLVRHAREHELSTEDRVELFTHVCEAVDHAHEQGVVHRDLKPDNVLVVAPGQPKVLDFGVARLTGSGLSATVSTGAGELLGSVPYMSPEQASGRPDQIDARSDVFSLGVLLFELLAERLPHELKGRPLVAALDTIRHAEPARLGAVRPELRGDLETIVGKCLEKEPERRYPSAAALVDELRRHLRHETIAARPPSTWYQLTQFTRRHRGLVGGALATLATLVAGVVVSLLLAVAATRNERLAEDARDASRREAYRANLTAASALLGEDPSAARAPLDAVPEEVRGWEWRYLDSLLANPSLEFGAGLALEDAGPLVAFDGGQRVAARIDEQTLGVWRVASGLELERIRAPEPATAWNVSPTDGRVVLGTRSGRVLARMEDGTWETWFEGEAPVESLAVEPRSARAAIFADGTLTIGCPGDWLQANLDNDRDAPRLGFNSDGSRLLTITYPGVDTLLTLWDASTLERVAARSTPGGARCFAFSADGALLALGEEYREIELCDPADLRPLRKLLGHQRRVVAVAFDDAGGLLSASQDGTIRLWDLDSGASAAVLAEPDVRALTHVSGTQLVSATPELLRLRNLLTRRARVLEGHASYVYEVAFSDDGGLLAAYVRHGNELSIWDPKSGELLSRGQVTSWVDQLGFDPDGTHIWLRGGERTQVVPWAAPELTVESLTLGAPVRHMLRHTQEVLDFEFAQTEPIELGPGLAIYRTVHGAGEDGDAVRAWRNGARLASGRTAKDRRGAVELEVLPRLYLGAWGDRTGHSFIGRLAELLIYRGDPSTADVAAIEAHLRARRLGAASELPAIESAQLLARFRAEEASVERDPETGALAGWRATNEPELVLLRYGAQADEIRLRPASDELACATIEFDGKLPEPFWLEGALPQALGAVPLTVFWLGEYERRLVHGCCYSIGAHGSAISARRAGRSSFSGASFARDAEGRRLAEGALRRGVPAIVREAATGEVLGVFGERVFGVALSPDGRRLVTGELSGRVDLWSVDDGALLATVLDHGGEVYSVAWSPDGERVATGGNDNTVVIREAATLERLLELRGHEQYVKALAFSPDGTQLASASGDRTVRVWDTLPPASRHTQALRARPLEDEVRAQVERWLAETADTAQLVERISVAFADAPGRKRAALKLIARGRP